MRLRMTRIQHHPKEKELFHTYQRVHTIMTGTMSWKVFEGKLGCWSWSYRQGAGVEGGPSRGCLMTVA